MTAATVSSTSPCFGHPEGQGIAQGIHLVTFAVWFWLLAAELRHVEPRHNRRRAPCAGPGTAAPSHVPHDRKGQRRDQPA
ncbi:hypothetical protein AV521_09450 [Streptomyces sp. IMTB 2501]|nr:hypothetical protein AV521_09450 [Streptomyces sp. IMTB 2501]